MKSPKIRAFLGLGVFALFVPALSWCQSTEFQDLATGHLADSGTSFGAAWGDYDGDGDLDLIFCDGSGPSRLMRNEGANTFTDVTEPASGGRGADVGAAWGDFDDDGDLDLFVTNANWPSRLLRNDGGSLVAVNPGDAGGSSLAQAAAWADYDRDGDLDLFVTYWEAPNKLYRNDAGLLVDATPAPLGVSSWSTGVAWGDFDNDRDPDLYVGGRVLGRLYRNEGSGAFVEISSASLAKTGVNGVAWGDCDNDGDLDLFLARDLNYSRLLRNDSTPGVPNFTDMFIAAVRVPGAGMGVAWLDYDNDGDLDVFLSMGGTDNSMGASNHLLRNNGPGSFTDVSSGPVLSVANSRGVAAGDFDNDGSLDLYVANWGSANQLLRNLWGGPGWIQVRLQGTVSNSHGIGARVRIVVAGKTQIREISGGSGLYSQDAPIAAFGLGWLVSAVDTIQVFWPSGTVTQATNVAGYRQILMRETPQIGVPDGGAPGVARLLAAYPNPFRASTSIAYDLSAASPVRLFVVDPAGRLIRTLETSDRKDPGSYIVQWDGKLEDGRKAAQGVYFYALTAGDFRRSLPIILVR